MEAPRVVPNIIGGLDNINAAHVIATNTDGHQIIVGAAANGAAVTGNPVLLAGSDGTNTQTIKTDNTGELIVQAKLQDGAGTGVPSTANDNSVVGINIYQIRPKVKHYNIGGAAASQPDRLFMGPGGAQYFYDLSFGQNNVKTWYAFVDTATTLTYEFVDSTGTIGTYSHPVAATTWTELPKALNTPGQFFINRYSTSTNLVPADNSVKICYTSADFTTCMYGGNYAYQNVSVFTVPAGHVAFLTNFSFLSASDDYPTLMKWSPSGIRSSVHMWSGIRNLHVNYYSQYSGIGGVFTAGESFCLAGLSANIAYRTFTATVICMQI